MSKEQLFYETLKNIFIGTKIEGRGGFVNLMNIKSKYYEKIEEVLKKDIDDALKRYPSFGDELFVKLYSFFSIYFIENGPIRYIDDEDVTSLLKARMYYYIKSDRIFKSTTIEYNGFKFYFDVSNIEYKKNNEQRTLVYEFKEITDDNTIVFNVYYVEDGVTNIDDILRELKKQIDGIKKKDLENVFRMFKRKHPEVDFFIHKDLKTFLQEQFKLWLSQYLWDNINVLTIDKINQLQILKDIAFKIIDFVSRFEDELVKIWNKPKFVRNSNYVITLDRLEKIGKKGIDVIQKLLSHENIEKQIEEWKELGIVDDDFNKENIIESNLLEKQLSDKYKFLPVDTKYFKDLELEILSLFDNLDDTLDGWLIKSENYQALNTLLPKFKDKIQTIYIDPPFNLGTDKFSYRTNYDDSTWTTLLENRLRLAKDWLNEKGSIFVRCDYNGNWIVRCLMDEIFGKENFKNEITIAKSKEFFKTMTHISKFAEESESLFFFSKSEKSIFNPIYIEKDEPSKYEPFLPTDDKSYRDFRIINGEKYYSPLGRKWGIKQEDIDRFLSEGRLKFEKGKWYLYTFEELLKDVWIDYQGYSRTWGFKTENSEIFVKRAIQSTSNEGDLVMDFFLGSGTTVAVAHKLKRKWVGIEMGEHFYSVVLPRMKKVLAYDKSGISKEKDVKEKYNEKNAGGFFKYYELEQFDDVLNNTIYENHDTSIIRDKVPYEQYIFMKNDTLLRRLEIDYENRKVKIDLNKLYPDIDIVETLSNLTGKWIKNIKDDEVEFEDGSKVNIKDLDYKLIKPLIWW